MKQIFFLNRPEVANAFDLKTAKALRAELKSAVENGLSYFIITSELPHVFCSGGDLQFYSKLKNKSEGVKANREIRKILEEFKTLPLFIAAVIEGDCIGGGCELALACDFIFSSPPARFAFKQVGQNLTPGWGGAKTLLDRVPQPKFLDWLSSGRWIESQEALSQGLVDSLEDTGQVLKKAEEFLKARNSSPEIVGSLKVLAYEKSRDEGKIFEKLWWSKAHLTALKRFLKK